jgi:hypothetical protein
LGKRDTNETVDEVVSADSRTEETNTNDTARTGDPDDMTVLEIALVVAHSTNTSVRADDGAGGDLDDIVDHCLRSVGDIDKHLVIFKVLDDGLSKL